MDCERYLARIGFEPSQELSHDAETLARLQRAHVRITPFETFSITDDPFSARDGEGISLSLDDLYTRRTTTVRGAVRTTKTAQTVRRGPIGTSSGTSGAR